MKDLLTASTNLKNEELVKRIYSRIKWDIRVNKSDAIIEACAGHVVLSGFFDMPYRHAAVVEIIKSTSGVETINDLSLVVSDYYRTDSELKNLIEMQIRQFDLLSNEYIRVQVSNGIVKLEGVVFRPMLKAFAASDSWGLSGVKDCVNLIEVRDAPEPLEAQNRVGFFDMESLKAKFDFVDMLVSYAQISRLTSDKK